MDGFIRSSPPQIGPTAELELHHTTKKKSGIGLGLRYTQRNYRIIVTDLSKYLNPGYRTNFISVVPKILIKPEKWLTLEFNFPVSYALILRRFNTSSLQWENDLYYRDNNNSWEFGAGSSLHFHLSKSFGVVLGGYYAITKLRKSGYRNFRNHGLQVMVQHTLIEKK